MTPQPLINRLRSVTTLHYGERIRPVRDWLVILGVSAVLLVVSVVWNTLIFIDVVQGDVIGSAEPREDVPNGSIETIRELFESRAAEETRYENEYRFVDPSR